MGFLFDNSLSWNSREFQMDYERIPLNSRSFDYCLYFFTDSTNDMDLILYIVIIVNIKTR